MANQAVLTGQITNLRLNTGTTQLNLVGIDAGAEGISITGNQFQVDGTGSYLAEISFYPNAITQGFTATIQIFNATTAAVVGSQPLPVQLNLQGVIAQRVLIPFAVVNAAHNFQIRCVVPSGINNPNALTLTTQGATNPTIMQANIKSVVSDAASGGGTFGSGADGATTWDGTAAVLGLAPVAGVYTLTRDIYPSSMDVEAAATIVTAGYRIFCSGTCNVDGDINRDGNAGLTNGTAGVALAAATLGASAAGGAGGVAAGTIGNATTTSIGGNSGAGGLGSGGAGGGAATATVPTAAQGGAQVINATPFAVSGGCAGTAVATLRQGGAGGGGGGGDGTAGGGGGSGGGVVMIACKELTGTGTISADGGAGGSAAAGNRGGGGGGGGGEVSIVSNSAAPSTLTITAAGGALGTGFGTGVDGAAGAAGTVTQVQVSA